MSWAVMETTSDFTKEHTKFGKMNAMIKSDGTVGTPIYLDGAMALAAELAAGATLIILSVF